MLLRPQPSQGPDASSLHHTRKRKADSPPDSNERLSKRLSLLNLEQNGQKLYVPVESAQRSGVVPSSTSSPSSSTQNLRSTTQTPQQPLPPSSSPSSPGNEAMRLDDTKHKVYIYSLDDELDEPEADEGDRRVLFLPDIEKHLRANRIPAQVLLQKQQPSESADLAKQLVLYQVPRSLSVPEERDSVRKAIVEARQRARERQEAAEREAVSGRGGAGREGCVGGGGVQGPALGVAGGTPPEVPMEDEGGPEDGDAMELD